MADQLNILSVDVNKVRETRILLFLAYALAINALFTEFTEYTVWVALRDYAYKVLNIHK